MKPSAKLLLLPVVSVLFGVAASSHANEALFSSPSRTLGQLWSGILECHDPAGESAGFLPRNRFDSDGTTSAATAVLDGTERRDYAACARQSLRDDSSRMLVETVERAMRHGGVALLGERFRLDSSISWVQGESVRGELDAVVPVWGGERPEGTGSALFLQHGLVVWEGLADEERIDANFGLAYRSHLDADTVAGGSLFYDYDFKRGHKRIGAGADIQNGIFRAAANYYHPLGGWRGGREGYEERALQGADLRFGFTRDRFSLDGRAGAWRFEGEENSKSEWRASYGVAGGYRILPGVFAEWGYERHDSKESLGSRWNAGLAFRFDLPGLEGSDSAQEGYGAPDLWRPVEREKRILYEERLALPRVRLRAEDARIAEGGTGVVSGTLTSALAGEAELHLMVHSSSTATHGADNDFTLAHMIPAADARSASGRSPGDDTGAALESEAFGCSELPCAMTLPAGATEFEILVNALEDLEREHDEHVDLRIDIPRPYTRLVRSRDIVRMTIGAHENTIAFAQTQSRMEEFNAQTREAGTANIAVGVDLPAALPVTLNIETGGSATRGEDYTLTPSVLTIPAGQGTGMITLTGINDALGEGDETVVLSLSAAEPMPTGWTLDGTRTHTLTISDDEQAIGFSMHADTVEEPASGAVDYQGRLAVRLTQPPVADVTVRVSAVPDLAGVPGIPPDAVAMTLGADATLPPAQDLTFTFPAGTTTLEQEITGIRFLADDNGERDEYLALRIRDDASFRSGGNDFVLSQEYFTVRTPGNDNTAGFINAGVFTTFAATGFDEDAGTFSRTVGINGAAAPAGGLALDWRAAGVTDADETFDVSGDIGATSGTVVIPEGEGRASFDIAIIDDDLPEHAETIRIELTESANMPEGWSLGASEERITINPSDNVIAFEAEASVLDETQTQTENPGTITLNINNPHPDRDLTLRMDIKGDAETGSDWQYQLPAGVAYDPEHADKPLVVPANTDRVDILVFTPGNDGIAEEAESVTFTLSELGGANTLPAGWELAQGGRRHTLTLADAPPKGMIGFAADLPLSAPEGGSVELDVVSSMPAEGEGSLWMVWEVAPGEEVVEPAGTVSIASGEDRGSFTVNIRDDADVENIEEITILLSGPNLPEGWSISGKDTHTLHIHASDNTVGFDAASETKLSEGAVHEGATHAVVTLVLTNPLPEAGAVSLRSDNPDIRITLYEDAGAVYEGTTLTIPSGITRLLMAVSSEHDADEEHEKATLTLGDSGLPGGWEVASAASTHDLDIEDDDVPGPTVSFDPDRQASDFAVQEGTSARITLRASEALPAEAKVAVALSGIADADVSGYILSATAPAGASVANNIVTIPAGATTVALSLAFPEDDNITREYVVLTLSADTLPEDWEIGELRSWQIAVGDNDTAAAGFASATTTDTEAGGEAILAVELSRPAPQGGLNLNLRAEPSTGLSLALNDASQATYVSSSAAGGSLAIAEGQTRAEFIVSHPGENDNLNNRFTVTLEAGAGFPGEWLVDSDRNTSLVVFNDATPLPNTIGWETSAIEIAEGGAAVTANLKLTDVASGGIAPAHIPSITMEVTHNDQADFTPFVARGAWSARYDFIALGSNRNFPADGLVPVTFTPVDDILQEGTETFTFRLTPDRADFPDGWEIDAGNDTLTLTVADNEIALPGGNVIEFVGTGASVNEEGAQSATATVRINHPNPDAMKVVLRFPAEGANPASPAQDYIFDISDNVSRDSGNVITIPGGTESFWITVTADDDAEDDDLETVTLLLAEDPGSSLPEGWGVGPSSRYTVTILDNDEGAVPVASLSQWPRDGVRRGSLAQLSSTTPEGGTASAAVYLTQSAPDAGGLNFILSVPEEYADDVTLANREDERSSLRALSGAGRYAFNMKSADVRGAPNLAALFDINVVDDAINEHPESFDITISGGANFPDGWMLRDEIAYRLTIPVDPADTGATIGFAKPASSVSEPEGETAALSRSHAIELHIVGSIPSDFDLHIMRDAVSTANLNGDADVKETPSLALRAGQTGIVSFDIEVLGDVEVEGDETIVLDIDASRLPEGVAATHRRDRHTVTIRDNDQNTVGFETPHATVREGEQVSLGLRFERYDGNTLFSVPNNVPLVIRADDPGGDIDFSGGFVLVTPQTRLQDGVFTVPVPVDVLRDEEREDGESVTFTLEAGLNPAFNFVVDADRNTFTLNIPANGQATSSGTVAFAVSWKTFREPYPGEPTGVPESVRAVSGGQCANVHAWNCAVHYFDLNLTGVPGAPFFVNFALGAPDESRPLGSEDWGYPVYHLVTPEDARDGRTRVPVLVHRDGAREPLERQVLELSTQGLPSGWSIGSPNALRVQISDTNGGQVWFAPNDADNGVETFNHSILNEGETTKVRIVTDRFEFDTPVFVGIKGYEYGNHPDIEGALRTVVIRRNEAWVDLEITAVDDGIPEADETFTLTLDKGYVLDEGIRWRSTGGRRIDPERDEYTFTIPANDGYAAPGAVARLAQWPLEDENRGVFGQLSATVPEGGVAQGAVVLNRPAPVPDGLNFILKIESGHEGDAVITNAETERSAVTPGAVPGEYNFNMKSGRVRGADNLAALFNIRVIDDHLIEEEETVDITIRKGANFPDGWTLDGDAVYRLTIPVDPADTDEHAVSWEKSSSVVEEDHLLAKDGTAIKLLVDGPLEEAAKIGMEFTGYVGGIAFASVTGGSYDADEKILTINPGENEVVLDIVSTGDVTGHTAVGILIWELSGADVLPAGWSIGRNAHDVTIEDNERTVTFDAPSTWVREGDRISAKLRISPPLITRDFLFPLRIQGGVSNINLYAGSATVPLETPLIGIADYKNYPNDPYGHRTVLKSDRSVDPESITLTFEAKQDSNGVREHIEIFFYEYFYYYYEQRFELQHFAPHFTILNDKWSVDILDDEARSVSFTQGRVEVNERERTTTSLQLSGPPLEEGETVAVPILIHGDRNAWDIISVTPSDVRFEDYTVHFDRDNTFATFEIQARQDTDYDNDTVTFSVDGGKLPEGVYVGSHGSSEIFMRDNRLPSVLLTTSHIHTFYGLNLSPHEFPVERHAFGNLSLTSRVNAMAAVFVEIVPAEFSIRLGAGDPSESPIICCGDFDYGHRSNPPVDVRRKRNGGLHDVVVFGADDDTVWQMNHKFTSPGTHSIWIHSVPDGTVIGDTSRVNFTVLE